MEQFVLNTILWTLALYGLIEIIKNVIYICTYTKLKSDGIYMVIAVKNQEQKIEGFMRSILFRFLYGKEECVKDIIVADLDSQDETKQILNRMQKEYDILKVIDWKECKELIENVREN
ncbi:MAG: hypothetical protein HFJ26_09075 [Clostridia bacterium]|nr:hypothetical protein [Clostridia bacterium]